MTITIIILSVLLLISAFIIYNLLRKNEKAEKMIIERNEFIESLDTQIDSFIHEHKVVLEKFKLSEDEELGGVFKPLYELNRLLKYYRNQND